jgi:hypothetical protein
VKAKEKDYSVRQPSTNDVGCVGKVAMSANDEIVLKANFEDWKQRIADIKGIDPWLYYCVEQFVKPYALDDEEILYGITDGGNDGGADAIYFLVNQRQLVTEDAVLDAKNVSKIRLIIIQCKHSGGFKPSRLTASASDIMTELCGLCGRGRTNTSRRQERFRT